MYWDDNFTAALISACVSGAISLLVAKKTVSYARLRDVRVDCCRRVEQVENVAVGYWSESGRNIRDEKYLISQFFFLNSDLKHIKKNKDSSLNNLLISLRMIVTGGDFESNNRKSDSSRIEKIQSTATSLRDKIQSC